MLGSNLTFHPQGVVEAGVRLQHLLGMISGCFSYTSRFENSSPHPKERGVWGVASQEQTVSSQSERGSLCAQRDTGGGVAAPVRFESHVVPPAVPSGSPHVHTAPTSM